jgi:hypothetical protein
MADMINNSRLSNGVRAAGLMRRAMTEALFVAHRRVAFGRLDRRILRDAHLGSIWGAPATSWRWRWGLRRGERMGWRRCART